MSVAGNGTPAAPLIRLRRSTEVSESNPRSRKAVVGSTAPASPYPRTVAAWPQTRSFRARSRSPPVSPASFSAKPSAAFAPSGPLVVRRASGSADSSGLGRVEVNAGANTDQSTSATVTVVSPPSRARPSAVRAVSGSSRDMPIARAEARTVPCAAMPSPPQGPQATEVAGSPAAWRCSARASR